MKKIQFKILGILIIGILTSCNNGNKSKKEKTENKVEKIKVVEKLKKNFKINFDKSKVSKFKIEETEIQNLKALQGKLSNYKTSELKTLPNFQRKTFRIVVPTKISKQSLENTMKSIVNDEYQKNKDIDEIIIFAYDNKNDIGDFYTFGKLFWGPHGKIGNVTAEITQNHIKDYHQFKIDIKKKVGNIKKKDIPTKRELKIYSEIVNENNQYPGKSEDEIKNIVMKKYRIKTEKEYEKIYLKVGVYKIF
ncbi:hypothetical protein LNJ05_09575 [Tenacibaculum finnmarkense genomovar ulcerans]|uniref:hypothetical protein n=1 Tax=Tenacibaculum finnmarkense TaxID=2781243 RepID=UPI001E352AFD|nr:hypothetical protein [Tenacibaculum finnmarkense]MCD8433007.1 hypothetical protein [Tenacibaculum finnmarkense genomovar ulcerans]